jgi:polygalacturonase
VPTVNGGPTGIPTNGVNITNIMMISIHGNAQAAAQNYYLLVANQTSPATWKFSDVDISGGHNSTCLVLPSGFTC